MTHNGTMVFIKGRTTERTFFVMAETGRVMSGPFPGGRYKPLPNQSGRLASRARRAATGDEFNDGAYSAISF